jgi:hypothetical protein
MRATAHYSLQDWDLNDAAIWVWTVWDSNHFGRPKLLHLKGFHLILMGWLGGRDSNPDTVVQSHVSYRWTTSQYLSGWPARTETLIISAPVDERQPGSRQRTGTFLAQ